MSPFFPNLNNILKATIYLFVLFICFYQGAASYSSDFECTIAGKFAISDVESSYYHCYFHNGVLSHEEKKCPPETCFNSGEQKCSNHCRQKRQTSKSPYCKSSVFGHKCGVNGSTVIATGSRHEFSVECVWLKDHFEVTCIDCEDPGGARKCTHIVKIPAAACDGPQSTLGTSCIPEVADFVSVSKPPHPNTDYTTYKCDLHAKHTCLKNRQTTNFPGTDDSNFYRILCLQTRRPHFMVYCDFCEKNPDGRIKCAATKIIPDYSGGSKNNSTFPIIPPNAPTTSVCNLNDYPFQCHKEGTTAVAVKAPGAKYLVHCEWNHDHFDLYCLACQVVPKQSNKEICRNVDSLPENVAVTTPPPIVTPPPPVVQSTTTKKMKRTQMTTTTTPSVGDVLTTKKPKKKTTTTIMPSTTEPTAMTTKPVPIGDIFTTKRPKKTTTTMMPTTTEPATTSTKPVPIGDVFTTKRPKKTTTTTVPETTTTRPVTTTRPLTTISPTTTRLPPSNKPSTTTKPPTTTQRSTTTTTLPISTTSRTTTRPTTTLRMTTTLRPRPSTTTTMASTKRPTTTQRPAQPPPTTTLPTTTTTKRISPPPSTTTTMPSTKRPTTTQRPAPTTTLPTITTTKRMQLPPATTTTKPSTPKPASSTTLRPTTKMTTQKSKPPSGPIVAALNCSDDLATAYCNRMQDTGDYERPVGSGRHVVCRRKGDGWVMRCFECDPDVPDDCNLVEILPIYDPSKVTKRPKVTVPVKISTPVPVKSSTSVPVKSSTSVPIKSSTAVPVKSSTPIPVLSTTTLRPNSRVTTTQKSKSPAAPTDPSVPVVTEKPVIVEALNCKDESSTAYCNKKQLAGDYERPVGSGRHVLCKRKGDAWVMKCFECDPDVIPRTDCRLVDVLPVYDPSKATKRPKITPPTKNSTDPRANQAVPKPKPSGDGRIVKELECSLEKAKKHCPRFGGEGTHEYPLGSKRYVKCTENHGNWIIDCMSCTTATKMDDSCKDTNIPKLPEYQFPNSYDIPPMALLTPEDDVYPPLDCTKNANYICGQLGGIGTHQHPPNSGRLVKCLKKAKLTWVLFCMKCEYKANADEMKCNDVKSLEEYKIVSDESEENMV